MNILALESATEVCSVALLCGEGTTHIHLPTGNGASGTLLSCIDQLLSEAGMNPSQLDGVAFSRGPGGFTSLRVGASVAKAIGLAVDCPLIPVSTLAILAQSCHRQSGATHVLAASDARRSEVYWGVYCADATAIMALSGEESVCCPTDVPQPPELENTWVAAGAGWQRYGDELCNHLTTCNITISPVQWPDARDLLTLAVAYYTQDNRRVTAQDAALVYLRNKVGDTLQERGLAHSA